jgi:hypothetical protein
LEKEEELVKQKTKAMMKDNTRYIVKMERQEIKVREGAQFEGSNKTVFMTKY